MNRRLHLFCFTCTLVLVTHAQHAQWTPVDSLNLQRLLHGDGEIKINKNAVKMIDFGSFIGKQEIVDDEPGLSWDDKLPKAAPEREKIVLTLKPYTATTPFNYDPIGKVKFKVTANTWRATPYLDAVRGFTYTNWAKKATDKGTRHSLEQIEATGLRYNPVAERANNMAVGAWKFTPGSTNLGNSNVYTHLSGFGVGGLDFNAVFTREFWDKSIDKRRARTLEVLSQYGDSTTAHINQPIQIITGEY